MGVVWLWAVLAISHQHRSIIVMGSQPSPCWLLAVGCGWLLLAVVAKCCEAPPAAGGAPGRGPQEQGRMALSSVSFALGCRPVDHKGIPSLGVAFGLRSDPGT